MSRQPVTISWSEILKSNAFCKRESVADVENVHECTVGADKLFLSFYHFTSSPTYLQFHFLSISPIYLEYCKILLAKGLI